MKIEELQYLLKLHGLTPRKEQGQNFLIDDDAILASIEGANVSKEDTVLEIGPGFGALTRALVESAGQVIAVEQDRVLAGVLRKSMKGQDNITIYNEDIREFNAIEAGLNDREYKLVANLPYSITSWILQHFLDNTPRPKQIVAMVQKEVAERIIAQPGAMSVLAVAVQLQATAEIVRIVPADSFHPAPKVDSAIISITRLPQEDEKESFSEIMRTVRIGFSSRRKQLHNNMQSGFQLSKEEAIAVLEKAELSPSARAQELSPDDWERLHIALQ